MADEETTETTSEEETTEETTSEETTTEETSEDTDWKAMARKHERRAKAEKKRADELATAQQERENATKSEHERAIEAAKAQAKAEALSEAQQERRNDRLEVAVTRAAAKTFADTDDALLHVQRGITAGDIDADDIFDSEGKVQTDALQTALSELLERKPHLAANGTGRGGGSTDAGKGSGGGKGLEDMSIEEHAQRQGRVA